MLKTATSEKMNHVPAPDPAQPAIAIRGAEKTFPNGFQGLAPIDLDVGQGEFLTLIGPSGCGKSTLLGLMTRLSQPTGGRLEWPGADQAGRGQSIVFQDATLMPWATIRKNVRLPLDLKRVPKAPANLRVDAALAKVGLTGFADRLPRQLSGGMRMRTSIARALVTDPELLLMDEPFGALDEFTRNKLDSDLLALWRDRGLTVVFVTHSIYEAVFLSTRVVVMAARPGRISRIIDIDYAGPRDETFRGSPRFAALCSELSEALRDASQQSGEMGEPQ